MKLPTDITWTTEPRRLGDLKPWEKNPRQLSKKDAAQIEKSMAKFGLADPLVINLDNSLIGGHQRKNVLGNPDQIVDCRIPSRQLTVEEAEELAIRLNRNSGDWDWDALVNWFEPDLLQDWGFDAEELVKGGFDLDGDKADDPGAQIDRAEELREKWGVELGQLWQLGDHRLICGDCTDSAVVGRVMGGEKADLFIADPPYGVSYADKNKFLDTIGRANCIETPIENDHQTVSEMSDLWLKCFDLIYQNSNNGCAYYIFSPQGGELMMMMMMMIEKSGWLLKHSIIWVKQQFVLGRSDYHYKHEPILYGWKEGGHKFYGDPGECSVWEVDKPHISDLHPTMKPIELCEHAIKNSSLKNGIVIDPFLGSGTTLIACERLSRKCRAVEISPGYCAVAIQRWVDMTGGEPVILEDGLT